MLKLNVGFNKKVGEPNYGSRGASINLELDFEPGLASDPERLRERVRFLFGLAKASVEEELHGLDGNGPANGHANRQLNGHIKDQSQTRRRDGTRGATASQARALRAIAERQGVRLEDFLRQRHGVDQPDQLSITEASELIDELKSLTGCSR